VVDALLFWLPSVKASRQLWERGQALWTERMTAALTGPCDDCQRAMASSPAGALPPTLLQESAEAPAAPAATAYLPSEPYDAESPPTIGLQRTGHQLEEAPGEATTSAISAYAEYGTAPQPPTAPPSPPEEAATTAIPSYSGGFGGQAPTERRTEPAVPEGDEHESHTVMLTGMPSLHATSRLVVLSGPVRGRQFSLGRDRTTIGRSIGCHVTVEADGVEYDHARVVRDGNRWQIEQAGSAASLFVNEEPVQGSHPLSAGDVIRIGPAQLRFESTS
jgi:hypothetical protein